MATQIIDQSIASATNSAMGGEVKAPVVVMKVRRNGKRVKQLSVIRTTAPPMVGDEVVRIINECDPIGFLCDIVNGKAIQCHVVDAEGVVHTVYETANLKKRVEVAQFLAERYMPKVAVIKHAHLVKHVGGEDAEVPDGRRNFSQIVTHAASKDTEPNSNN